MGPDIAGIYMYYGNNCFDDNIDWRPATPPFEKGQPWGFWGDRPQADNSDSD